MTRSTIPDHYYGEVVRDYEAQRVADPVWSIEQATVEFFVGSLAEGASVLDVPVGTGRFLQYYAKAGCAATAFDVSADMLARSDEVAGKLGLDLAVVRGDILNMAVDDDSFDAVVSFRLLTWFDEEQFAAAVRELSRVARLRLLVSFHTRSHPSFVSEPLALLRYAKMLLSQRRKQRSGGVHIRLHKRSFVYSMLRANGLAIVAEHVIKRGRVSTYSAFELQAESGDDATDPMPSRQ